MDPFDEKLDLNSNIVLSDLFQTGREKIVIPTRAAKSFRDACKYLTLEQYRKLQSQHLDFLLQADTIPQYFLRIGQYPWWLPDSENFKKDFQRLKENQGRDQMRAIKQWLLDEAEEDNYDGSCALKSLKMKYKSDGAGFETAKNLLTQFVHKSKVLKTKTLGKQEVKHKENALSDDQLWEAWVEEKIEPPPVDENRPLIFYSDEEICEYKKQKRCEKCANKKKADKEALDGIQQNADQKRKGDNRKLSPSNNKKARKNVDRQDKQKDDIKVTFSKDSSKRTQ